ncbi:MAG: ABC transporter permease [Anderseniella sp.]|jgi:polar amino acid transport system permease protein|nr:ABC transporter permease [Anderseniella sp.]
MSDVTAGMIEARKPPPGAQRRWTFARIAGWVMCALWIAIGVALVASLVRSYDPDIFWRYMPRMLEGLLVTAQLVVSSVLLGGLLALPLALARMSSNWLIAKLAFVYVYVFRGTPLLGQMFLMYYGAGQFVDELKAVGLWWFFRDAYNCVLLTFTLNTAAYQAEIYKTAIESIPRGQWEAAQTLGLRSKVTFFKIIMPQAMITALRPLGNEIILMIKGSAVASVVTVFDLMGATKLAFSRTYDFTIYMWAAIIYLMIVETLRRVWGWLESRLTRHLVR